MYIFLNRKRNEISEIVYLNWFYSWESLEVFVHQTNLNITVVKALWHWAKREEKKVIPIRSIVRLSKELSLYAHSHVVIFVILTTLMQNLWEIFAIFKLHAVNILHWEWVSKWVTKVLIKRVVRIVLSAKLNKIITFWKQTTVSWFAYW